MTTKALTLPDATTASPHEVKLLRARMNMTQAELADELGVTEYSVWRWEHGKKPMTKAHTKHLRRIASDTIVTSR